MDWLKKHSDQALLLFLSLLLLGMSVLLILKALGFDETFASLRGQTPHSTKLPPLEMAPIQQASTAISKPNSWASGGGSLFVSEKYIVKDGQLIKLSGTGPIRVRGQVPNDWFENNGLDILSDSILDEDADADGFTNLDEWKNLVGDGSDSTNPQDWNSHPPYYTKLRLAKAIQQQFRLKFASYDGDPAKPESLTFQINTLDVRQPSQFRKLNEQIEKTKFKIIGFKPIKMVNQGTGAEEDVSELTLQNTETGDTITLVYNKVVNSPDSFAQFRFLIDGSQFAVKKDKTFFLKPEPDVVYKLIDIKETQAVIQSGTGKPITVLKEGP